MTVSEPKLNQEVAPTTAPAPGVARTWWIDWINLSGIVSYHVLAIVTVVWFFSWWGVALAAVGHYTISLLGINLCYHRLLSHRAFACPLWLEHTLAVIGVCCSQDTPAYWVATHRRHHHYADQGRDPHSPTAGFLWSYVGWLFIKDETTERRAHTGRYSKDLLRDPFYAWLETHWVWVNGAASVVFFAAGFFGAWVFGLPARDAAMVGLMVVLWGVVVRTVLTWHVFWAVNAVSHRWGYRNYDTKDDSTNNLFLALIAHGDWHNNHHAAPTAAMHGHRRFELDPVFGVIRLFGALGLAWDIIMPATRPWPQGR